jgi:hypothetical protein
MTAEGTVGAPTCLVLCATVAALPVVQPHLLQTDKLTESLGPLVYYSINFYFFNAFFKTLFIH